MIELLKKRMMTLQAVALSALVYIESEGGELIKMIGDLIDAGTEGGMGILGAVSTALLLVQNKLNKDS